MREKRKRKKKIEKEKKRKDRTNEQNDIRLAMQKFGLKHTEYGRKR